jgi:hypothetical protein
MSEGNETIVRRLSEELWNKGNLSVTDEFFARTRKTSAVRSGTTLAAIGTTPSSGRN